MSQADLLKEYVAKAEEAERQAAKAGQKHIKDVFLKMAATYREAAKVLEG
jgi:hypothetical protein